MDPNGICLGKWWLTRGWNEKGGPYLPTTPHCCLVISQYMTPQKERKVVYHLYIFHFHLEWLKNHGVYNQTNYQFVWIMTSKVQLVRPPPMFAFENPESIVISIVSWIISPMNIHKTSTNEGFHRGTRVFTRKKHERHTTRVVSGWGTHTRRLTKATSLCFWDPFRSPQLNSRLCCSVSPRSFGAHVACQRHRSRCP
jgi:hypothetical protein